MIKRSEEEQEIAKVLLDLGTDVHAQDKQGSTPLRLAVAAGHIETGKVLVEIGGSVLAQDAEGSTPMPFAAAAGHEEIVRILMKEGGDAHFAQHE